MYRSVALTDEDLKGSKINRPSLSKAEKMSSVSNPIVIELSPPSLARHENILDPSSNHSDVDNSITDITGSSKISVLPAYVRMLAAIASLNSCCIGYGIGVNTGLAYSFQRGGEDGGLYMSDLELEMYMGVAAVAALLGSLLMYLICDTYGRRITLIFSQVCLLLGSLIMIVTVNYFVILFGKVFVGISIGLGLSVDPMYIAEVSPAPYRGQLVSWAEFSTNFGILLGFASGYVCEGIKGNAQWRLMLAVGMILPVLLIVLVFSVLPESPRWLVLQGRTEEAALILQRCSDDPYLDGQILVHSLQSEVEEERDAAQGITWYKLLFQSDTATNRKLIAGIGVAMAQQLSGIDGVQYYMLTIFKDSGIESTGEQYQALLAVGVIKVAVITLAGYFFDKFGRKTLLLSSYFGMCLSLLLLGISQTSAVHTPVLGFLAVLFYVSFFSIGAGPGAWLVSSEVFSNDIRAKGMSLAVFSNRVASLLNAAAFLTMLNSMGPMGCFGLYACLCFAGAVFVHNLVPETKGKTLEEMFTVFKYMD